MLYHTYLNNITCTVNCNYRIPATLCTIATCFISSLLGPTALWELWPLSLPNPIPPYRLASCAECLEIWHPHLPGTFRACPVIYWACFTDLHFLCHYVQRYENLKSHKSYLAYMTFINRTVTEWIGGGVFGSAGDLILGTGRVSAGRHWKELRKH